ncbi:hypothetical protein PR003_g15861 [Phytophthora rubi]|uniref:Crinkler effector protein N-terminal domain-containing protein n=2 Tax=Phytophthora rubi TaxID=129364 RepID=A0A6A4EV97_9STRA|nr:hypothetical protein PR003_g15861 [Phytophthora rubi]
MVKFFCAIAGVAGNAFAVDIDAGETVGDFKEAIQKNKPNLVKGEPDKLNLFLAKTEDGKWLLEKSDAGKKLEGGEITPEVKKMIAENKMMPTRRIQDVLIDFKMTGDLAPNSNQIHVLVVLPEQKSRSTKKRQQSKRMKADASCCAFLFELARNLAKLYDFKCGYGDGFPIMDDVFSAVECNDWEFRLERGKQLADVELPNYFTEEEWDALKNMNENAYRRIYVGKPPTTSEGIPYIILPHAYFTRHEIDI